MKYKVGDKVKIRSDLEEYKLYGGLRFIKEMLPLLGKIVTITETLYFGYKINEDDWEWTDEMIEGKVEDMEDEDFNLNVFKEKSKQKVYKGWAILKMIADGEIKEGTKIKCKDIDGDEYILIYKNGKIMLEDEEIYSNCLIECDFEIIEDQEEINIQDIEKLDEWITRRNGEVTQTEGKVLEIGNKLNTLIQAIKQLDKKIKEKE